MLLIMAFGVYVIVRKKVHITSKWVLTGENARNFGVALLAAPIPVSIACGKYLPYVLPPGILHHPIGGRAVVLLVLVAVLLAFALMFRDKTVDTSAAPPIDHKTAV